MELPTHIREKLDHLGVLAGDVQESFVRGSGPGGQKINKTASTVVLVHGPTGVSVRIQDQRSQAANREIAWETLCAKLAERNEAARREIQDALEKRRRTNRPKSHRQKKLMVAAKRERAVTKQGRGRVAHSE